MRATGGPDRWVGPSTTRCHFSTTPFQGRSSVCGPCFRFLSSRPLNPFPGTKGPQVGAWLFRWKNGLTREPVHSGQAPWRGWCAPWWGCQETTVQQLFLHLLSPVLSSPLPPCQNPPEVLRQPLLKSSSPTPITQMDQSEDYSLLVTRTHHWSSHHPSQGPQETTRDTQFPAMVAWPVH